MLLKAAKKDKEKGALNLKQGRELLRKIAKDAEVLKLEIMVDGKKLDGEWLAAEVLNIPFTGPGLQLAPKADFNDGMLDLICFDKKHRDELCDWLETPADKPPPGTTRRGRMITLSWRNAPYRIDDEAIKAEDRSLTFTITCDGDPVTILESPLRAENNSSQQLQAVK
jgi:hypothetical protein